MLHAILYNNASSGEVLKKDLSKIAEKTIVQYDAMAIESPTLILSGEDAGDLRQLNYLYINEFDRFYDCTPILLHDGNYQLNCVVDPLMSFADEILTLEAIVDKNQYDSNMYLNDGSFITESRENIEIVNFTQGFSDSAALY